MIVPAMRELASTCIIAAAAVGPANVRATCLAAVAGACGRADRSRGVAHGPLPIVYAPPRHFLAGCEHALPDAVGFASMWPMACVSVSDVESTRAWFTIGA